MHLVGLWSTVGRSNQGWQNKGSSASAVLRKAVAARKAAAVEEDDDREDEGETAVMTTMPLRKKLPVTALHASGCETYDADYFNLKRLLSVRRLLTAE
jgi:hypothetical protein